MLAQHAQHLVQSIRGVGVIDHDQRLRIAAERLQTTGRRMQLRTDLDHLCQRHTVSQQHADDSQQVVDVESAQQRRLYGCRTKAAAQVKAHALRGGEDIAGLQPLAAGRCHKIRLAGGRHDPPRRRLRQQRCAEGIIGVDHCQGQISAMEQRGFGRAIGLHIAVKVQVVMAEVGKHSRVEAHCRHPTQCQRMRRHL